MNFVKLKMIFIGRNLTEEGMRKQNAAQKLCAAPKKEAGA